jgi:squalene-associated FAD-dependent desaturase
MTRLTGARVAVVGGGLAGIAAALELADAGASVTLYEARSRLGGATYSVRRRDHWIDNGQHVLLRCCLVYRAFLARLGVERLVPIQPRLRIPVLREGEPPAFLRRARLPAPLHLAPTLLRYALLDPRERLSALRAAAALRKLDPSDESLDSQTFGAWLRAHGQDDAAVSELWDLITVPTLNLPAAEGSLMLAAMVFRTGLLDAADACDIGVPSVPLQRLHGDAAAAALEGAEVRVALSAPVRRVARGRVVLGEDADEVDAVVVAVPHDAVAGLVPDGVVDPAALERLGASPIVNLHVQFDRRVLEEPFAAAASESPLQWLFDRTESSGIGEGQLVSVSLSGAAAEIGEPLATLRERYLPALHRLLPASREAEVLDFTATREPRATFRAAPGTARMRPGARTRTAGLYLAGAWTDTGWPATMESAVRSGLAAASAAASDLERGRHEAGAARAEEAA